MALRLLFLLFFTLPAFGSDFRPNLGPDLPGIEVSCGKVTVLFRRSSQWTPARFDFDGKPMSTEKSAYGTVFLFPEIGFIGTNHLENEPEELQSLVFELNGKKVDDPTAALKGTSFRLTRKSRIRDFDLENVWEIRDNRLIETVTIGAKENVPLKLVYPFMHAWLPSVSGYIAGFNEKPEEFVSGDLHDGEEIARKFFINEPVDWLAVFEPESSQFAVCRLIQFPENTRHSSKIWNVPGTYRKQYLTAFSNQVVHGGFRGTWKMVTEFGKAKKDDWEEKAAQVASKTIPLSE